MSKLRVLDTGLRGAVANLALGAALLPGSLRFFRFPPSVLIGRHQKWEDEVDLLRTQGLDLARRLTGGGAVFIDPRQLCWELVLESDETLPQLTETVCTAVASGLSSFGLAAVFRPGNDIEVEGRKISGTAGWINGKLRLLQGTLLVDGDIARMAEVLTPPADKPEVAERVVTVAEVLKRTPSFTAVQAAVIEGLLGLGFSPFEAYLSPAEEEAAAGYAERLGNPAFLERGEWDGD